MDKRGGLLMLIVGGLGLGIIQVPDYPRQRGYCYRERDLETYSTTLIKQR